jgi:hypothetical protein
MLDFALSAFVTLLLVVDPVGLAPAFLAATGGMSDTVKRTIALRAPLIAASILVVIALVGNWLLRQLGIGIPAFQIAGGLLLFGVSYQMIFGDRPHREAREADKATSEHASALHAVLPLREPDRPHPRAHRKCGAVARARHAARRLFRAVRDQRHRGRPGEPAVGLRRSVNPLIPRSISWSRGPAGETTGDPVAFACAAILL